VPIFRLDGLSKSLGLAHIKVGWIRTEGSFKDFDALEYILDASLNCSYLSQALCARALPKAKSFQEKLMQRLNANREMISNSSLNCIPVQGGWYQSIYFDGANDEELCLRLLKEYGILTHPGFLFDFPDGYLVISLLQRENLVREFVQRPRYLLAQEQSDSLNYQLTQNLWVETYYGKLCFGVRA